MSVKVEIYGMIPELNEDGTVEKVTTITPNGICEIRADENHEQKEYLCQHFADRPIGSILTFRNDRGDILEIIKSGEAEEGCYDIIHHMEGAQDMVRNLELTFVMAEFYMGHYDWNSRIETKRIIADPSPITETVIRKSTGRDREGNQIVRITYEQIFPDGTTRKAEQTVRL